jgi:hypothetical protein
MANPNDLKASLNELIKDSPENIKAWLNKIILDKPDFFYNFSWLGLASVLSQNTNHEIDKNNREMSLIWAELAIKAYAVDSELANDKTHFYSNELSEMMLRARLINQFGEEKNHFLLDSKIIFRWFFERLNLSFEAAINESENFRRLTSNKQLELIELELISKIRQIKNRLSVIDILRKNPKVKISAELEKWLEIKSLLI